MSAVRYSLAATLLLATAIGCGSAADTCATSTAGAAAASTRAPSAPSAPVAPVSAVAVFQRFVEAINRGDAGGASALIGADATWERGGQCPPGQCTGLTRAREEIDRDVAAHHQLAIASNTAAGDTVTARLEVRTDGTRRAGVERVVQVFTVRVADGKIVALRAVNDLDGPATAAFAGPRGRQ